MSGFRLIPLTFTAVGVLVSYAVGRPQPSALAPLLVIPVLIVFTRVAGLPGFPIDFLAAFGLFSLYIAWQRSVVREGAPMPGGVRAIIHDPAEPDAVPPSLRAQVPGLDPQRLGEAVQAFGGGARVAHG